MGDFKIKLNNGVLEYKDDTWYLEVPRILLYSRYKNLEGSILNLDLSSK